MSNFISPPVMFHCLTLNSLLLIPGTNSTSCNRMKHSLPLSMSSMWILTVPCIGACVRTPVATSTVLDDLRLSEMKSSMYGDIEIDHPESISQSVISV